MYACAESLVDESKLDAVVLKLKKNISAYLAGDSAYRLNHMAEHLKVCHRHS